MKNSKLIAVGFLLMCMSVILSSCEAIAGIFKAGVWTGVIIVVGILGIIIYFASRRNK